MNDISSYTQAVEVELISTIATSYYQLEMYDAQRAIQLNTQQVEKLTEVLAATELRMRYDSEVNYLQVLLARQSLLEARLSLLSNRYELLESGILLYKALGGESAY